MNLDSHLGTSGVDCSTGPWVCITRTAPIKYTSALNDNSAWGTLGTRGTHRSGRPGGTGRTRCSGCSSAYSSSAAADAELQLFSGPFNEQHFPGGKRRESLFRVRRQLGWFGNEKTCASTLNSPYRKSVVGAGHSSRAKPGSPFAWFYHEARHKQGLRSGNRTG